MFLASSRRSQARLKAGSSGSCSAAYERSDVPLLYKLGLGGLLLGATGCVRNLPRYQGLAGLARRSENARRGTAEEGEGERRRSGGARGGLSRTVLESANVGEAGLRWGQMVGCVSEERRGERERGREAEGMERGRSSTAETHTHTHIHTTRWGGGHDGRQAGSDSCSVAVRCCALLLPSASRRSDWRAVNKRP